MKIDFFWHSYKYLPYERKLAKRELMALFKSLPVSHPNGFTVKINDPSWQDIAKRVTYFRGAIAENGERVIPRQALLEASANGGIQDCMTGFEAFPSSSRQSTRYSAHGIHEYRGKFNPQIVRAIGNLLNLSPGDWILDPFCGSGTTLLETAYNGWNGIGLDINPLGIEIAKAKLAALRAPSDDLRMFSAKLTQNLNHLIIDLSLESPFDAQQKVQVGGTEWEDMLPNLDYLRAWFTESVLVQLAAILRAIEEIPEPAMRAIFRIVLSNILRDVSLQEPADLRIRRRKSPPPNVPVIPLFVDTLVSWIENLLQAQQCFQPASNTVQKAILGDVRQAVNVISKTSPRQIFSAAITSPPYVTALPYIDTQRLSLAILGLINAADIRTTERQLIGNREITNRQRQVWEDALRENQYNLPIECWQFCCELAAAVNPEKDGFRRQNKPALTYQYFSEMAQMFEQVKCLLRPSAPFVLVVGSNRTKLGGRQFVIDTAHWLRTVAEQRGFRQVEVLELDTYQRYSVHQANSIRTETMLILEVIPDASQSHSAD
ncbi:MAG TPA: site-specific DNA-methyltransferase [Thermoflexia bacterium]|nr:site-specific DNA-methyltransferase [Thermoflexia bacterium]